MKKPYSMNDIRHWNLSGIRVSCWIKKANNHKLTSISGVKKLYVGKVNIFVVDKVRTLTILSEEDMWHLQNSASPNRTRSARERFRQESAWVWTGQIVWVRTGQSAKDQPRHPCMLKSKGRTWGALRGSVRGIGMAKQAMTLPTREWRGI